jgi:hypothetical protein
VNSLSFHLVQKPPVRSTVEPYHQFRFWRQDAGEELDHEILEVQLGRNFEQLKVSGKGLKIKTLSN